MNHTPHLLAAIFLCGLYLPIWILIALSYQDVWRCAFCGYSDGIRYLQNPKAREQDALAAEQKRIFNAQREAEKQRTLASMPRDTMREKLEYAWVQSPLGVVLACCVIFVCALAGIGGLLNAFSGQTGNRVSNESKSPTPYATSSATPYATSRATPYTSMANGTYQISTPTPSPTKAAVSHSKTATVISDNANLRTSPDALSDIVSTVTMGSTVEVLKQKGPWFQVRTGGTTGWMHGNTIQFDATDY